MRISVDRQRCAGAGMCALTAPEVFDQSDEDGRVVLVGRYAPETAGAVRQAVDLCPAQALALVGDWNPGG